MSAKSRAIRLSRLHAINWYGYQDTLPVQGNLVLAGVTGSGKSILMDLLMLVLVGPERARHHFNRSATGSQSDRTIKGYCLLDTKREENGQPTYFHDKGVTTYLGAEFVWPDGKNIETWGLRIEFRNASENDGHITPFFYPGALEKEHFIVTSPEDGKRRPLDILGFRQLIEKQGGRLFPSSREYLRDMCHATHLNFNRDVLDRLLPSAMSFTNLKSFDDFCRRFVLPGEAVPVDDVVASYRDFESYEKELRDLRGQLTRLQNIREHSERRVNALRDREVARYAAAELHLDHAKSLVTNGEQRLEKLKADFAGDEARLKELDEAAIRFRQQYDEIYRSINSRPDGPLFLERKDQTKALEAQISALKELSMKLSDRLRKRVKDAREWLKDIKQAPLDRPLSTLRFEDAITMLHECDETATMTALANLRDAADQLVQDLRKAFAPDREELAALRREAASLNEHLTMLRSGLPPVQQPLLHTLRENPLVFRHAKALREVCEVADENWRAAIEVAFTQKFAVLVEEKHFAEALRIYHDLPASTQGPKAAAESLIHPRQMLETKAKATKGSLAEKIETSDPVARACVDHWFGEVRCVSKLADFEKHASAILQDGLMQRDGIVQRARHYDGLPFVGQRGLQRQMEIKKSLLDELEAKIRRLAPLEIEIDALIKDKDAKVPDHATLAQDLVRVEQLPVFEQKHEELMQRLAQIDNGAFLEMEQQAEEFRQQEVNCQNEAKQIIGKGIKRDIDELAVALEKRRKAAADSELAWMRVQREIDVSAHLERYKSWKAEMLEKFLTAEVAAKKFEEEDRAASEAFQKAESELRVAMVQFKAAFSPRFNDLPEDGKSTKEYLKLLTKIDGQGIPEFEKKAEAEKKRWEHLFRTQVLSRMQQALKRVEDIIFLLNKQLKRPIGNDLYKIDKRLNPDFRFYRQLIDLNALQQPDELFFNSIEGELRMALTTFLSTLTEKANSPEAARLLDYRQYFDYDLLVTDIRDPNAKPVSVDKQSGKMSGGENQSPYFVAILASYLHAYNRHETRWKEPSLALVPIDEAFSKLSGERIQDCIKAMHELDLQGVFSMSSGNIPYAFSLCDELIIIVKNEKREGGKTRIRNIPTILFRDSPEGQEWMTKHGS